MRIVACCWPSLFLSLLCNPKPTCRRRQFRVSWWWIHLRNIGDNAIACVVKSHWQIEEARDEPMCLLLAGWEGGGLLLSRLLSLSSPKGICCCLLHLHLFFAFSAQKSHVKPQNHLTRWKRRR